MSNKKHNFKRVSIKEFSLEEKQMKDAYRDKNVKPLKNHEMFGAVKDCGLVC